MKVKFNYFQAGAWCVAIVCSAFFTLLKMNGITVWSLVAFPIFTWLFIYICKWDYQIAKRNGYTD